MGLWKDKTTKTWKFKFQMGGKVYGGGGHKTRKAAVAAREQRRIQEKENLGSGKKIQTDMGCEQLSNAYLDWRKRRHAPKTSAYKQYVFVHFIKHAGDL